MYSLNNESGSGARLTIESKLVILFGIAAVSRTAGGSLEKLWKVQVKEASAQGRLSSDYGVFAPDLRARRAQHCRGCWQVVAGESVLILDTVSPAANQKRIRINPHIDEWDPMNYGRISWTVSGQHIIIRHAVIRVSDGTSCSLPSESPLIPGFLVAGPTLAGLGGRQSPHRVIRIGLPECRNIRRSHGQRHRRRICRTRTPVFRRPCTCRQPQSQWTSSTLKTAERFVGSRSSSAVARIDPLLLSRTDPRPFELNFKRGDGRFLGIR